MTEVTTKSPSRRIWSIAGPSILANLSGAMVGIVDVWAIGHLSGEAPLAGLAVGSFLIITIYMTFSFLYMGTVGLVAQCFGAKRPREAVEIVLRSAIMALGFGLLIVFLSPAIVGGSIAVWAPSPSAAEEARAYLTIRLFSVPAIFATMVILGFLIGTQKARLALYLELFLNIINVVLTFGLVVGLGWGAAGAALGSLVAEWAAAILGGFLILSLLGRGEVVAVLRDRSFWALRSFRKHASINGFFLARTLFIQLVFATLSVSGARLGDTVLAANHVLLQMVFITSLGLVGMSSATQALVGEAKGAGDRASFHYWSLWTAFWSFLVGLAFALCYWLAGREIIAAFTNIEAVREIAQQQISLIAFWPLFAVWSYQLDGIFIGASGAKQMMWCAGAATLVFIGAQEVLAPIYGNRGLWIAFIIFFSVRALALIAYYPGLARRISEQPR